MIHHSALMPKPASESDDLPGLDDPFFGLLGQPSRQEDLWLGKTVPRYTSYPPATAFQDNFTPGTYRTALELLAPERAISLYMHVPYCKTLCLYCGCHTCATQRHEDVSDYLALMHRELETIALSAPRPRLVSQIHLGGGSPNILSEKDFGLLFGALARRFDLSGCREVAVELDPRQITKAQVRTLAMMGVTRVSLGVQDFNPEVQKAIGREQPFAMVRDACDMLRAAQIEAINFDLIYGLPFQSPTALADTARLAASLSPSRIALFSYAHVPQLKKHQRALEQYIMPGPHASLAMETMARNALCDAGYVEIGMDHFAKPSDSLTRAAQDGRLRRNFQGYTDDTADALLGVGASSIGKATDAYFQNARDLKAYGEAIQAHGLATTRGLKLSGEDRFRAAIIESLMCTMSVNLERVCRQFDYSLAALAPEIQALAPFEEHGIVRREGHKITMILPSRMAVRVIASLFDKTARSGPVVGSRAN